MLFIGSQKYTALSVLFCGPLGSVGNTAKHLLITYDCSEQFEVKDREQVVIAQCCAKFTRHVRLCELFTRYLVIGQENCVSNDIKRKKRLSLPATGGYLG